MGLTRSGAFYYAVNNNVWDIKIAELDPSSGKVVTPLQSAFKHGNMRSPDWSPDGHFLAGIDANEPSQAVIIHSMDTGEERELQGRRMDNRYGSSSLDTGRKGSRGSGI